MKKPSLKKISEEIWSLESKYDLLNKKINNVFFWKLLRNKILTKTLMDYSIFGQAHPQSYESFFSKVFDVPKIIKNQFLYGAISRKSKKNILIFENSRKKKVDGKFKCLYTGFITKYLKNYELIERPYLRKHYDKPSALISYNDHFSFYHFFTERIIGFKYDKKELEFINNLEKELYQKFKIKLNLKKMIREHINIFNYEFKYYDKLLKKRQPKTVILVVSYNRFEPLIAACKKNNVETIEIQHGIIHKYHLGYSFPNNDSVPYFPDKLWMFGKYFFDSTYLPLREEYVKYIGYPYMENRLKRFKNVKKNKKEILFISQGTKGKKISKVAYQFLKQNNEYNIIYKLHPGEYDRWQNEYPWLLEAQKSGLKIIDNNDTDLYALLGRAEYVIGVNSTVIFEAMMLDCKILLLNISGVEPMEYLINNFKVPLIKNEKDLLKVLKSNKFEKIKNKEYFFAKPNYNKIFDELGN